MFRRLVATSRAPQIMVLSMLRSFGKIGPQIDQIWAWLSRGHRWSPGVRNPLKSSVTGPSLSVNCYLEIKFHKIIRVNPPPPPLIMNRFLKRTVQPELFRKFCRLLRSQMFLPNKVASLLHSDFRVQELGYSFHASGGKLFCKYSPHSSCTMHQICRTLAAHKAI